MSKRHYGRISKQLPAIVANEDGMRLKVVTVDASIGGVSILCNIYQRDVITPGGSFIRNGRPVKLSISLDLSNEDGQLSPIVANCHISYSRRISKDKCMIGMRYIDFENNSQDRLFRFISDSLALNEAESASACA